MLLLIFKINDDNGNLIGEYKGIDIERGNAGKEDYREYAYRKGSARGGNITPTTKLGFPVEKKISTIKETTFNKILALKKKYENDVKYFTLLKDAFSKNEETIKQELTESFKNFDKNQSVTTGLSFKVIIDGTEKFLREFGVIKHLIIESGAVGNYTHAGIESKAKDNISSV